MGNSTKELFKDATLDDVAEFVRDPRNVHYIGMLLPPRPGVRLFSTRLEYEHYVPGTVRNGLYRIAIINREDIIWVLISIPKEDAPLAGKIAGECGLRFADGVPTIIASEGSSNFRSMSRICSSLRTSLATGYTAKVGSVSSML